MYVASAFFCRTINIPVYIFKTSKLFTWKVEFPDFDNIKDFPWLFIKVPNFSLTLQNFCFFWLFPDRRLSKSPSSDLIDLPSLQESRSTPLETLEVDEWEVYLDCDNPVDVAFTFSFGFGAPSLVPVFPTAMQIPVHFSTLLSSSTPHSISAKQFLQRQSQL